MALRIQDEFLGKLLTAFEKTMAINAQQLYRDNLAKGMNPKDAAKQAQSVSGVSLVTGQPIRQKKVEFTTKGVKYGQYPTL
jgi:hypothetical protein